MTHDDTSTDGMTPTDHDRLTLLDRIAERMPDVDLSKQATTWTTLDDGAEALLVDGGGIDGGSGMFFANAGEDVHVVGSLAPLAPAVGCIVVQAGRQSRPRPRRGRPAGRSAGSVIKDQVEQCH
jgi:hypothetical protein